MKIICATRMTALALSAALAGTAHAALQGRDLDGNGATFEAYYDTALDITWLADANYAKTQFEESGGLAGNVDGAMTWEVAKVWVQGLNAYGLSGWQLPSAEPFYGVDFSVYQGAPFINVQANPYWFDELYVEDPSYAWTFYGLNFGGRVTNSANSEFYAWAVRPGDVATIPEPETYAMLLAGLGLVGAAARRRKQPKLQAGQMATLCL